MQAHARVHAHTHTQAYICTRKKRRSLALTVTESWLMLSHIGASFVVDVFVRFPPFTEQEANESSTLPLITINEVAQDRYRFWVSFREPLSLPTNVRLQPLA